MSTIEIQDALPEIRLRFVPPKEVPADIYAAVVGPPGPPGRSTVAIGNVVGLEDALNSKQPALVSGGNIKTINGQTVLGAGDLTISGGSDVVDALSIAYTSGRVSSITEDGVTTTLTYDGNGRLSTVVYPRGGKTRTETYTYNPDGSMAGMAASEA